MRIPASAPSLFFLGGKNRKKTDSSSVDNTSQAQQTAADQLDIPDNVLEKVRIQHLQRLVERIKDKHSEAEQANAEFAERIGQENAQNPEFIKNLKGADKTEYEGLLKMAADLRTLKKEADDTAASYGMVLLSEEEARKHQSQPS